jgi:hypothetical protein
MENAMRLQQQRILAILALAVLALTPMGAAWAQVKVTAADPASTTQGTVSLYVTVSGSGFNSTAKARFLVAGTTDTGGVTVTNVVVHGSNKLVATIDVADTAAVAKFDIEVTLSSGRKGKGTTLFSVQAKTNDPCTRPGLDFPAFTYWRQSGTSRQLFVADATGTCSRSIMTNQQAQAAAFVYPVAGTENIGRIVFPKDGSIQSMDFAVNHADNTIILGASTPLFDSFNVGSHELSPDGTTVYFSTGAGSPEGFDRLHRLTIGDAQPPQEIYRSMIPGAGFQTPSVSADGTTLVVEEIANFPEFHRVLRVSLPCSDAAVCTTVLAQTTAVAAAMWPSLDSPGTMVAYSDYLNGSNNCFQMRFTSATTGAPQFSGTQPRYGTASSWLGTGLLVDGRKPPDRKGTCRETGFVTLIDPATGAEIPLISGYGPDAR